jgi:hypothetical protein
MTGTDCGLFTHKSVPVMFESPFIYKLNSLNHIIVKVELCKDQAGLTQCYNYKT